MKCMIIIFALLLLASCSSRYYFIPAYVLPIYDSTKPVDLGNPPYEITGSDCDKMNFQGNVKSVHERLFGVSRVNGKITKEPDLRNFIQIVGDCNRLILFNESGRIVNETLYDYRSEPENFYSYETRTYNSGGNLVERYISLSGYNRRITEYTYDQGRIESITLNDYICSGVDSSSYKGHIFYDNHIISYTYDSLANTFTESTSNSKVTHHYDANNNRINSKKYTSPQSDTLWLEVKYLYDNTGKLLEENVIHENNRERKRIVYKYDDKGNPATLIAYRENNVFAGKESYSYTYDANGNWISKVVLINNMPIAIIERAIEYY